MVARLKSWEVLLKRRLEGMGYNILLRRGVANEYQPGQVSDYG
jgi:hypothetical protein